MNEGMDGGGGEGRLQYQNARMCVRDLKTYSCKGHFQLQNISFHFVYLSWMDFKFLIWYFFQPIICLCVNHIDEQEVHHISDTFTYNCMQDL